MEGLLRFGEWLIGGDVPSVTALAFHSHICGRLIRGEGRVLIADGKIQWENLRRSHISERDLREELRLNANVDDPCEVELAMKERSGEVGVVKKGGGAPRVIQFAVRSGVQTVRVIFGDP